MSRPGIDQYYTAMLPLIASRATCPRRQVGAILVDQDSKLVSIGYNGPPSAMPHCIVIPCGGESDEPGNNNKCIAVHAEMNAVTQAASSRRVPYTIYCSATPCFTCAKLLISVGVHRVIALELYKGDTAGCDLMEKAGVAVRIYRDNVLYHWKNV